jgi:porin
MIDDAHRTLMTMIEGMIHSMNTSTHFAAWAALLLIAFTPVSAQQSTLTVPHTLTFGASYVGDYVSNVHGRKKTGSAYLGMANLTMDLDFSEAGIFSGAHVFLKASNTHGVCPSDALIGDFQVMSNIEAGDHTYVQELWYRQPLGALSLIVGLQDMNALFAVNEYSGIYLNSSFGVHSTIAANLPAPIFPLTSVAATLVWPISDRVTLLASVHDGSPIDFEDNPYNLKWHFRPADGVLGVTEAQLSTGGEDAVHGVYKLGLYTHNHLTNDEFQGEKHYGVYCTIDQAVSGTPATRGSVAVFARAGLTPSENDNYTFVGAGVNVYGLVREDGADVLGLGFAHAGIQSSRSETAIELTYQTPVTEIVTIQPDLQYIIHPAGDGGAGRANSMAATVRCAIRF